MLGFTAPTTNTSDVARKAKEKENGESGGSRFGCAASLAAAPPAAYTWKRKSLSCACLAVPTASKRYI